jgi:hypothetical protein
LSTAGEDVRNIHNNGGRRPCKRKITEELSIDLKIHSWYPSKIEEVEHEERKTET